MAFDLYVFDPFAAPLDRHDFLDWISQLECGMDLMGAADYSLPR